MASELHLELLRSSCHLLNIAYFASSQYRELRPVTTYGGAGSPCGHGTPNQLLAWEQNSVSSDLREREEPPSACFLPNHRRSRGNTRKPPHRSAPRGALVDEGWMPPARAALREPREQQRIACGRARARSTRSARRTDHHCAGSGARRNGPSHGNVGVIGRTGSPSIARGCRGLGTGSGAPPRRRRRHRYHGTPRSSASRITPPRPNRASRSDRVRLPAPRIPPKHRDAAGRREQPLDFLGARAHAAELREPRLARTATRSANRPVQARPFAPARFEPACAIISAS